MTTPARHAKNIPAVAGIFANGTLAGPPQDPATSFSSIPYRNGFESNTQNGVSPMAAEDRYGIECEI